MDRYSVPKSVFYHVDATRVEEIVRNQKRHDVHVRGAQSVLARNHELELGEGIQRVRFWKKTRLKKQMNNNLGTPFSISTQVRGPQQLRMLYTIFQHHSRLRHIKDDATSHHHNRPLKEKPDRFAKRVRELKEVAYKSARKRYLGISWKRTEQQLHPKPPSKPRPKGLRSRKQSSLKSSGKAAQHSTRTQAQHDLELLIKLEMKRLATERHDKERIDCRAGRSPQRRVENVRSHTIPQRTKTTNVRRTQSARKRPKSARHRPSVSSSSSRRAQSARRPTRKGKSADSWRKPSVLREILRYAGTLKGRQKFGTTVPEFVRNVQGFMRTRNLGEIHRRLQAKFAPQRTARTSMFCAPAMYRARTARTSMMFRSTVRPTLRPSALQMSAARARARVGVAEDGSDGWPKSMATEAAAPPRTRRKRPESAGPGRRRISVLAPKTCPSENLKRGTENRRVSLLSQVTDLKTTQLTAMFKACGGDLDLLEKVIASTETAKLEDSAEMEAVVMRNKLAMRPPWDENTSVEADSKWCTNTLDAFADGVRLQDTAWLRRTAYANVRRQRAGQKSKNNNNNAEGNEKEPPSLHEQLADRSTSGQFEPHTKEEEEEKEEKKENVVSSGSPRAKEKVSRLLSKRKISREMSNSHVRESFCVGLPSQPSFELERHLSRSSSSSGSESDISSMTQPKPAIPLLQLNSTTTGLSSDIFLKL